MEKMDARALYEIIVDNIYVPLLSDAMGDKGFIISNTEISGDKFTCKVEQSDKQIGTVEFFFVYSDLTKKNPIIYHSNVPTTETMTLRTETGNKTVTTTTQETIQHLINNPYPNKIIENDVQNEFKYFSRMIYNHENNRLKTGENNDRYAMVPIKPAASFLSQPPGLNYAAVTKLAAVEVAKPNIFTDFKKNS